MPKHTKHFLELARRGAESRMKELRSEIAEIVRHFPHLGSAVSPPIDVSAEPAARTARPRRTRRKMSADARRKISEAQKKRWAAVRKGST